MAASDPAAAAGGLVAAKAEGVHMFLMEYKEQTTGSIRRFQLTYFVKDKQVEMYEPSRRRLFLKRVVPPEDLELDDLFLGNLVTIMSRPMRVVEYASARTRSYFEIERQTTAAIVKPDALPHMGRIMMEIAENGFEVGRMRLMRLSAEDAEILLETRGYSARDMQAHQRLMTADAVLALELSCRDSVSKWQRLCGPADPDVAKEAAPASLRARYGTDPIRNAVHAARTPEDATRELEHLFDVERPTTACFTNCAAMIIRPHCVRAKQVGNVLHQVLGAGLEVSALRSVAMNRGDIADFFACYKGVIAEHGRWAAELNSGVSVVCEVRGEQCVERLRRLAGPYDSEIARVLAPESLRGQYGVDRVRNCVHVTDLHQDGPFESKFLFAVAE